MNSNEQIKEIVKRKYGEIAKQEGSCCGTVCGPGCGPGDPGVNFSEGYDQLAGYAPDADLGLGCGLPTETAGIKNGDTVLDLGSGAGNDIFVARAEAGSEGRLIGLDMAPEMVEKAKANAQRLGCENVEFILGEIEEIPLSADEVDVVVSNCVLNLVPNKAAAFAEVYRVLKPGGHFSISDIVLEGVLPEALEKAAIAYVGCVAGAQQKEEYLRTIEEAGFVNVDVLKSRVIELPVPMLESILGAEEAKGFLDSGVRVLSVTVWGQK
jgi:arsenite methyltransferase